MVYPILEACVKRYVEPPGRCKVSRLRNIGFVLGIHDLHLVYGLTYITNVVRPVATLCRTGELRETSSVRTVLGGGGQPPLALQPPFDGLERQTIDQIPDRNNQNHHRNHLAHVIQIPAHHE